MDIPVLFTHSPTDGHLGCFQVLAIVNKAAKTSLYRFFSGHKFSTHLGKYQGVRLLDCMVRVCLVLQETAKLSFAFPFFLPISNKCVFLSFYILAIICQGFGFQLLQQVVVPHCFHFKSLMAHDVEHLFMCLFATCISSLMKCSDFLFILY